MSDKTLKKNLIIMQVHWNCLIILEIIGGGKNKNPQIRTNHIKILHFSVSDLFQNPRMFS